MKAKTSFDKYKYYLAAVQSPEGDLEFLRKAYADANKNRKPKLLREDFCGTYALCCEWAKHGKDTRAIGIDIDPEPLSYGTQHYFSKLAAEQQKRVEILQENVLTPGLPAADIIASLNFSYFCFKQRATLLDYFKNCHRTLNDGGVLVLDCFGGSDCLSPNEQEIEHDTFSYFWDQDSFNPITNEAMFYIHFKLPNEPKQKKVFTYDWRMWSLPELSDLLTEAGFSNNTVYWEGTDENGEGNGVFDPTTEGEECESWVTYVVAEK
jgi:SAM-dependent methyltransferase